MKETVYQTALLALYSGINPLPIPGDGSKRPLIKWQRYQKERVSAEEVQRWFLFEHYPGLAFVTGSVSGGLELLDFDEPQAYHAWIEQMRANHDEYLLEALLEGYVEASPKGIHILYRCPFSVEGNQKLAGRVNGEKYHVLIETRGEGGLVVVAPSSGGVHPSRKPYRMLGGSVSTIPQVTVRERQRILETARSLDERTVEPQQDHAVHLPYQETDRSTRQFVERGVRPGEVFNQRASWEEVLCPYGWSLLYVRDEVGYWTKHQDVHATTNHAGSGLFYPFTTTTCFEAGRGYTKFSAYTLLHYGVLSPETFALSARDLARQGYTTSPDTSSSPMLLHPF